LVTTFGRFWLLTTLFLTIFAASAAFAKDGADSSATTFGNYEPNSGFKLVSTDRAQLNVRIYTYVRYLNQLGLDAENTDSFGNTTTLDRREDIQFQKAVIYFSGWLMDPKFRYMTYVWTSNTSQGQGAQVVVGGFLNYAFSPRITLGAGVDGLPGVRATEGNFPYWLTVDNRLIADEFFRPSYTMGVWAKGKVLDRLTYRAMLGNNLSQLGVDAGQLDDKMNTVSLALIWLPTTGEFGTNGGFGDFDTHRDVATRLAAHLTTSTEDRQGAPTTDAFENVQIRLSDGNPIFTPDLFGAGIQVDKADYRMFCTDGGVKYRGLSLDGEYYWRRVDNLTGPGIDTLPFDDLKDHGFQLQASGMVMPKQLQLYAGLSKVYGEYGDPWDLRFGVNWHPAKNHVLRWNAEVLHTEHSPVGGLSLPTLVGATGEIIYTSFQVNF
jgi:hypothetical protein